MPSDTKRSLLTLLVLVPLPANTVLFAARERPRYVHFVTSGMVSLVTTMRDGAAVEIGLSGHEGLPESLHLLGSEVGSRQGVVQIAGTALRMDFLRFEQEFATNEAVRRLVLRYVQYEALVLGQVAACNRLHTVTARLARWLLMVQERTGESTLGLTQDLLGQMLGTRRSSVTLAAGELQRAGLIEYRRADIHIVDEGRLRGVACECTEVIHTLYQELQR